MKDNKADRTGYDAFGRRNPAEVVDPNSSVQGER
jgi:hypothetical protein